MTADPSTDFANEQEFNVDVDRPALRPAMLWFIHDVIEVLGGKNLDVVSFPPDIVFFRYGVVLSYLHNEVSVHLYSDTSEVVSYAMKRLPNIDISTLTTSFKLRRGHCERRGFYNEALTCWTAETEKDDGSPSNG
jgi:hypothetical protein